MRAFWDESAGNFGDVLGPLILERLAGIRLEWSRPEDAELFAIGSIAEAIPPGYRGWILGTGAMFSEARLDLRWSRCLALRGPLTLDRARLNEPPTLLADLGLLASMLVAKPLDPDVDVGVMPHYADRRRLAAGRHIDPLRPPLEVLAEIARCRQLVTSSLHGLVAADAFGIPSVWMPSPRVLGDGYKFRDYAASFGQTIIAGVERRAPDALVVEKQQRLLELLGTIG